MKIIGDVTGRLKTRHSGAPQNQPVVFDVIRSMSDSRQVVSVGFCEFISSRGESARVLSMEPAGG